MAYLSINPMELIGNWEMFYEMHTKPSRLIVMQNKRWPLELKHPFYNAIYWSISLMLEVASVSMSQYLKVKHVRYTSYAENEINFKMFDSDFSSKGLYLNPTRFYSKPKRIFVVSYWF